MEKIVISNKKEKGMFMRINMGLMLSAVAGIMVVGIVGGMLSNTKAARRRRMIKKAVKTVHNVGCAMQKMTAS